MATITKLQRPTGAVYKARVRKQGHPVLTKTFTYHSDAKKWARKLEAELERDDTGLSSAAQKHTLGECIARYRAERIDVDPPELAPGTREAYSIQLRYWDEQLGHLKLSELHPDKIAKCRDSLETAKKPSSVNRYLAALAAVLTRAVKHWHWLESNPVGRVVKLTENNARTRFLSEDELHRILEACRQSESPDLYLAVLISVTTGARRGELLNLRWRDVDFQGEKITVRVGNENEIKGGLRSLPIAPQILPMLVDRKATQSQGNIAHLRDSGLVFPGRTTRRKPVNLRKSWATALDRAGIRDFHWHDLRHSAASFLAKNGATLLEIGVILGHRSPTTTKRYSHLTEQHTHRLVLDVANKTLSSIKAGGHE